jgi:hypothetical protein
MTIAVVRVQVPPRVQMKKARTLFWLFYFEGLIRKHIFLRRLQNKKITKREALVAFLSK